MKQKLHNFIINSIKLPAGIAFKLDSDGLIVHQEDPEDETTYYVYLEVEADKEKYDGLMFSKYQNPVEILKKIEKIIEELKSRI